MLADLSLLFRVYVVLLGLGLLGSVWVWRVSFGLGRMFSLLFVSLVIWFGGHLMPVNSDVGVAVAVLVLALGGMVYLRKVGLKKIKKGVKRDRWRIIVGEILFACGFFGLSLVRGFSPDILGLEKLMDFGFIKSYLVHAQLPVPDMWFAGESINYYSFGHFMASILIRLMGVVAGIGYNLVLGVILGLSLNLSFEIVVKFFGKMEWKVFFGGIVGALMMSLGGNSHTIWYLIKNWGVDKYWYPDATRFIERTIHEFPGYSFVVSDLHGHVLDLPIVLTFLLVLLGWKGTAKSFRTLSLGILFGVMAMTNTWDLLIYGLLIVIFSLWLMFLDKNWWCRLKELLVCSVIIGVMAVVVAWPWYVNFEPISSQIKLANEHSPLWRLGVLWGGHIGVTITALVMVFKKKSVFVLSLGMVAIILLVLPELVYVKDIYSGHPRANTMFKLTYQAFILMSLLAGIVFVQVLKMKRFAFRLIGAVVLMVFVGGVMIYSYLAFKTFYGLEVRPYRGLDGVSWFNNKSPGEAWVVWYLSENRNGVDGNIVEAVGDSYTEFNAISAYSGVPTIIGWRVHEWLWRGGYDAVADREKEVKEVYEGDNADVARGILDKYNVGFVVLGSKERQGYEVNERKLLGLGKIVIKKQGVILIEVY